MDQQDGQEETQTPRMRKSLQQVEDLLTLGVAKASALTPRVPHPLYLESTWHPQLGETQMGSTQRALKSDMRQNSSHD